MKTRHCRGAKKDTGAGEAEMRVSQNTRRLEERCNDDPRLSEKVYRLKRVLSESCSPDNLFFGDKDEVNEDEA